MSASRRRAFRHTTWSSQLICLAHTAYGAYATHLCRLGHPYK